MKLTRAAALADVAVAVVIAAGVGAATAVPGGADPTAFSTLSCDCADASTPSAAGRRAAVADGIRDGYRAWQRAHTPHVEGTPPARSSGPARTAVPTTGEGAELPTRPPPPTGLEKVQTVDAVIAKWRSLR